MEQKDSPAARECVPQTQHSEKGQGSQGQGWPEIVSRALLQPVGTKLQRVKFLSQLPILHPHLPPLQKQNQKTNPGQATTNLSPADPIPWPASEP